MFKTGAVPCHVVSWCPVCARRACAWRRQVYAASWMIAFFLVLHLHAKPFEDDTLNHLESVALVAAFTTQMGSLTYFMGAAFDPDAATATLITVNAVTLCILVGYIVFLTRSELVRRGYGAKLGGFLQQGALAVAAAAATTPAAFLPGGTGLGARMRVMIRRGAPAAGAAAAAVPHADATSTPGSDPTGPLFGASVVLENPIYRRASAVVVIKGVLGSENAAAAVPVG